MVPSGHCDTDCSLPLKTIINILIKAQRAYVLRRLERRHEMGIMNNMEKKLALIQSVRQEHRSLIYI